MSAQARIEELKQKFDDDPRRYFAPLANEYRKVGDLDRAIALCEEHLSAQPEHLSGHVVLGKAYFARGDRDAARRSFERALEVDPENLDALHQLALLARDAGDGATALQLAQRALAVDPFDPELMAMAADLSAPPEEDVAPPSFDPRSMFEEFVPPSRESSATAPASSESAPRPRMVDELLRGFPPEALEDAPSPPESTAPVPVAEQAEVEASADSMPGGMQATDVASTEAPPSPAAGAAEGAQSAEAADGGLTPPAMEEWGGPPPDDLPDVPDALIADWPGAIGERETEEPEASDAAEVEAIVASAAASDEAPTAPGDSMPAEDEELPAPVAAAVVPPLGEPVEEPMPMAGEELVATDDAGSTPPHGDPFGAPQDETVASLDWPDVAWPADDQSTLPPHGDAEVPAVAEDPALPTFTDALSELPAESEPVPGEPLPVLDAAPASDDVAVEPSEARAPLDLPEIPDDAVVASSEPDASDAVLTDTATPAPASPPTPPSPLELPPDPPLARLPEEAEVPPEARVAFATETMAELLASQGRREEAVRLYAQLAAERPDDPGIRRRIEELAMGGAPTPSDSAELPAATQVEPGPVVPIEAGDVGDPASVVVGASGEWPRDAVAPPAESGDVASDAPPANVALPMRELLNRILSFTPASGGDRIATPPAAAPAQPDESWFGQVPVTTEADVPLAAGDAALAGGTVAPHDDAAARVLSDAVTALADPRAADTFAHGAPGDSLVELLSTATGTASGAPVADVPPAPLMPHQTPARQAPSFSFDQFFRDAMPDEPEAGAPAPPVQSRDEDRREEDVDDFRAWLDGLRKS